jgi:hypothetical protein
MSATKTVRVLDHTADKQSPATTNLTPEKSAPKEELGDSHAIFRGLWLAGNLLLIGAVIIAAFSFAWEYSTRRYLSGFSDAVVPASSTPEEKVEAILNWMANGPARLQSDDNIFALDRNPTDTLNYAALLQVCGSATNAFVNLADSAGLTARRLLLLTPEYKTKHVVAEVLIGGRWVVVDPAYRMMLRDPNGKLLTRDELRDPDVLLSATSSIYSYDQDYTYDHTAHIRWNRLGPLGGLLRRILDRWMPTWEGSATVTLLVERDSFTALVISLLLLMFVVILRVFLRWYGLRQLGVQPPQVRRRLLNACAMLVSAPK